jgi:hypothetical protein
MKLRRASIKARSPIQIAFPIQFERMSDDYQNNHYVPAWYQRRFMPVGHKEQELYCLDFAPGFIVDSGGIVRARRAVRRQGFRRCFAEKDLYTTRFGAEESTTPDVEQLTSSATFPTAASVAKPSRI